MRNIVIYRHQLFRTSEVFIQRQAGALVSFCPVYAGRTVEGKAPEGAIVESLESRSSWRRASYTLFFAYKTLLEQVAKHSPVLVHAHFGVDALYGLKLAQSLGVPLVTTFHGFDATTSTAALIGSRKPAWIYYSLLRKKLAKEGDLFICVSDYIRQRVLELGFPEKKTITHYIGVDTRCITPVYSSSPSPVVLHVARLVEKKGTRYLIQAFSQVINEIPEAELVIIGDGPLRRELEVLAESLGASRNIRFLGSQPNSVVLSWMCSTSLLVLPSVTARSGDAEGLGMVLHEASAHGLPVVATCHGGIPEAVVDGKTGFLVEERDAVGLSRRIVFLLKNEDARQRMGRSAREVVERKFDLYCQARELEQIYESLL